ncbi:MAG: MFS transporter [Chloroflexi bacterium]|nr:MFS transporter [Chloroflexota bacterium]
MYQPLGSPVPSAGRERLSLRSGFSLLGNQNFRILLTATLASNMGFGMQILANGYLAYQLTGSYAAVGFLGLATGIPMLLLSLVGGAAADRSDKRRLLLLTQFLAGGLSLTTGMLVFIGLMTFPLLFVISIAQVSVMTFRMPTQMSLLPQLVTQAELGGAVALNNATANAARPIAPALAGLLLAGPGVETVYFTIALIYALTMSAVWRLRRGIVAVGPGGRRGMRAEIVGGLRYLMADRMLLVLLIIGIVPMLFMMPMNNLLPGFVKDELLLPPDRLGLLVGTGGVGALVGSLVAATYPSATRRLAVQVASGVLSGLALIGVGFGARTWGYTGALGAMFALGMLQTVYMSGNMTAMLTAMRPEYYGRMMSILMMTWSLIPLMALPIGFVADAITAATTFMVLGGIVITAILVLGFLVSRDPRPAAPADAPLRSSAAD